MRDKRELSNQGQASRNVEIGWSTINDQFNGQIYLCKFFPDVSTLSQCRMEVALLSRLFYWSMAVIILTCVLKRWYLFRIFPSICRRARHLTPC